MILTILIILYSLVAIPAWCIAAPRVAWADSYGPPTTGDMAWGAFVGVFLAVLWGPILIGFGIKNLFEVFANTSFWDEPGEIRTPTQVLRERRENAMVKREKDVLLNREHINSRERELGLELTTWQ